MPTTCNITFDNNPQKVCYSGTLLQGSVFLTLTNSKSVRGLFIKIKGDAHARWSEGSGKNKRTYTGEETYLNERTYFAGGANGKQTDTSVTNRLAIEKILIIVLICPQLISSFSPDRTPTRFNVNCHPICQHRWKVITAGYGTAHASFLTSRCGRTRSLKKRSPLSSRLI